MRQVRQYARADDAMNVCPMKLNVWRMSSARTSVATSVVGMESERVRPAHGPAANLTRSVPMPVRR